MTTALRHWDGGGLGACLSLVVLKADAPIAGSAKAALMFAAASDDGACAVRSGDLGRFLLAHAVAHIACHGAGELYLSLDDHFGITRETAARDTVWRLVRDRRLIDVGLLDQLLRIARAGYQRPRRLPLQALAKTYANVALPGDLGLRHSLAGSAPVNPEVAAEAATYASAAFKVFRALADQARLLGGFPLNSASPSRHGFLALALQVKADVAMARARRGGVLLADGAMPKIVSACESARDAAASMLRADTDARQWLRTAPDGRPDWKPDGSPKVRGRELKAWLAKRSRSLLGLHQTEFMPPSHDDRPSDDPADWADALDADSLLLAWNDVIMAPAVGRSCVGDDSSCVPPSYEVLPRLQTRTPDLDFLLRHGVEGVIKPDGNSRLFAVRLRHLPLRALAAVCLHRFGRSVLAEVFRRGDDPIEYAAGSLAGRSRSAFGALRQNAPADFHRRRRAARLAVRGAEGLRRGPCL